MKALLLQARLENEIRTLWNERLCKSGKTAEFISEVQRSSPEACTVGSLETSLMFMNSQPYTVAYLRPKEGLASLHLSRRGLLHELLDPARIHPSTRLLVLVQPSAESTEAQRAALALGERFVTMTRTQFIKDSNLRVLGPHLLPCRLRSEVARSYRGSLDKPLPTEAPDGTPSTRIWVFRTDC